MKILAALAAFWPRFKLEAATIDAYYTVLGDLDTSLLKAATLQVGSEARPFFPAAGELRQCAFDLVERHSNFPTAWDAWSEVCKRIGDNGYISVPEFTHPLIKKTVDCVGGWLQLCWSENAVADRARFVQAYETLAKRERAQVRMLPQVREALELASGKRQQEIEAVTSKCADKLRSEDIMARSIREQIEGPGADSR